MVVSEPDKEGAENVLS
jgi:hypothetical protein